MRFAEPTGDRSDFDKYEAQGPGPDLKPVYRRHPEWKRRVIAIQEGNPLPFWPISERPEKALTPAKLKARKERIKKNNRITSRARRLRKKTSSITDITK